MAIEKKSKSISRETTALLKGGETEYVDFKRTPDGVQTDDLVAFANSSSGGNLLIGVAEELGADGSQFGVVVGCDISDGAVLQIVNKAISCIPPIAIKVYAENTGTKPLLRIHIPSSENKPHSTPKGLYCRRDGSRNRPLHPSELLHIFLDNEGRAFAQRFEDAASRITDELADLQAALDRRITDIGNQFGWAEFKVGETEDTVNTILAYVQRLTGEASDTASRLRVLFRQDKREDPVRTEARKKFLDEAIEQLSKDPDLVRQLKKDAGISVTVKGKAAIELEESDLKEILSQALDAVRSKAAQKKEQEIYRIDVKEPGDCSDAELEQFVRLVTDGGEVGQGLDERVRRAANLALLFSGEELVGTAGIKHPFTGYRSKVFWSAKAEESPTDYPFELGWIYVAPGHRGKRQAAPLIRAALNSQAGSPMFATTRNNNGAMHHILEKMGFTHSGLPYASQQHKGEEIVLYLRCSPSST